MNSRITIRGYEIYPGVKLMDADLSGLDLSNLDLSQARLYNVNLAGTNLTGTNLKHARLVNCNLTQGNLTQVDLSYAVLTGSNLTGVILTKCKLMNANLQHANLSGLDLRDISISCVDLRNANLDGTCLYSSEPDDQQGISASLTHYFTRSAKPSDYHDAHLKWAIIDAGNVEKLSIRQLDPNNQIRVSTANKKIEALKPQLMEIYKGFFSQVTALSYLNQDIIRLITAQMLNLARLNELVVSEIYIEDILNGFDNIVHCESFWEDKAKSLCSYSRLTPIEVTELRGIFKSNQLSNADKFLAIKKVANQPESTGMFAQKRGKAVRELCQSILDETPEAYFQRYKNQLTPTVYDSSPSIAP